MSFHYTDVRDANQHLLGTVVMFAGQPAFIHEIQVNPADQHGFIAHIGHLPRINNMVTVDLFSPDLEPKKLRLGYVNVSSVGHAMFCSRIPAKQYHQGLCRGNVSIPPINGQRLTSFERLLTEPGFADALRNQYPTYEEAARLLENPDYRSMAFHRSYALEKDELGFFRLFYKGEPVAFGENKQFKLADKFKYLREEITELGVQV